MVKQISVFLENTKGRLAGITALLAQEGVNILALSIADTTNFGILRAIVPDTEKTLSILKNGGYTANQTDVLALRVPHQPGGLAKVMDTLSRDVSVEYIYSTSRTHEGRAVILCKVDDEAKALELLKQAGIEYLTQEQLVALG